MSEYIYVNENRLEKKLEGYPTTESVSEQIKNVKDELNANIDSALSGGVDGEINLANYYTKADVDEAIAEKDFVINVTGATEVGLITFDKTLAEMNVAYHEGKNLYIKGTMAGYEGFYGIFYLQFISEYGAIFQMFQENSYMSIYISPDDSGTLTQRTLVDEIVQTVIETVDAPPSSLAVKNYVDDKVFVVNGRLTLEEGAVMPSGIERSVTYEEVRAAYDVGKEVVLHLQKLDSAGNETGASIIVPCTSATTSLFQFSYATTYVITTIALGSQGGWNYSHAILAMADDVDDIAAKEYILSGSFDILLNAAEDNEFDIEIYNPNNFSYSKLVGAHNSRVERRCMFKLTDSINNRAYLLPLTQLSWNTSVPYAEFCAPISAGQQFVSVIYNGTTWTAYFTHNTMNSDA